MPDKFQAPSVRTPVLDERGLLSAYWQRWILDLTARVDIAPVPAPVTASDPGFPGQYSYDAGFFYVCVAKDTWMRAALVAF